MIEGWAMAAAAVTAGAGIVSGVMSSRAAKKQSKFEAETSKEMIPLQGQEERRNMAYEYEYADYMQQKERQRKANAFAGLSKVVGGSGKGPTVSTQKPGDPNPVDASGNAVSSGIASPSGSYAPELQIY